MEELKDLTNVIRNLAHARAFTIQGDQPSKEKTAEALEGSIRKAIDAGDGLQHSLIHTNADAGTIMSAPESEALVQYLAVRRDVLSLLEAEQKDTESEDEEAADAKEAQAAQAVGE